MWAAAFPLPIVYGYLVVLHKDKNDISFKRDMCDVIITMIVCVCVFGLAEPVPIWYLILVGVLYIIGYVIGYITLIRRLAV